MHYTEFNINHYTGFTDLKEFAQAIEAHQSQEILDSLIHDNDIDLDGEKT